MPCSLVLWGVSRASHTPSRTSVEPKAMTTPSSATQKQRDVAHDGYMPQLRDRVQELEVCWDKICAGEWSWDHLASLRHQAHILAESASFLGTSTVTATLQQLVQIFTHMEAIPPDAPAPKMRADIDTLFTSLTAAVQASESDSHIRPLLDSSAVAERSEHESIVLIVEDDSAAADHMTVQLEHFGYHAIVVPTLDGVADAVRTHPPVAIVLAVCRREA